MGTVDRTIPFVRRAVNAVRPDDELDARHARQPDWAALHRMPLADWRPIPQLRVTDTQIPRSRFGAIDFHNHLGKWLASDDWSSPDAPWMIDDVPSLVDIMDSHNVEAIVNLDGMWGSALEQNLDRYDRAYPGRFYTFCQLDWDVLRMPDGEAVLIRSLDESHRAGARGVKVWKNLGLTVRDGDDALVQPDDDRVQRILGHAGDLGLPVLIHTADPKAFFDPLDERNERLEELTHQKDWWFGDRARHPSFARLIEALATLVKATPQTVFIGAHAGCAAEDLDWVEALLDTAPNFHIDIAGRIAELGRQPRRFRRLVEHHPDRVLFGTDVYPATPEQYRLHFRFLESDDEYFDYSPDTDVPPQGRWAVSALDLPVRLLERLYSGNARAILGSTLAADRGGTA